MSYSLRNKSCIPAYHYYISCGNLKCKTNCNKDSLPCVVCDKVFHYKCAGLSKKAYLAHIKTGRNFYCSDSCIRSLSPFNDINNFELLTTLFESSLPPCKKCKKECLNKGQMKCIQCHKCLNYFHIECVNMSESVFDKRSKSSEFFCPGKCEMSIMPFNCLSNNAFVETCDPLSDFFPCIVCKANCINDCIQCDLCDGWVHNDCSDLGSDLSLFIDSDREFFVGLVNVL